MPDGEKTLTRSTAWLPVAQKVSLFVLRTETRLCHRGESAWLRYESHCRDDQFVNAKGKPMDTVPLVMRQRPKLANVRARNCIKRCRNWLGCQRKRGDGDYRQRTGYGRRRTTGSMDALKAAGFPEKQFIRYLPNLTTSRGHLTLPTNAGSTSGS